MLAAVQLAMCSSDMAATLRLYSEAFGFDNAGGQGLWGPMIRIQGLDESARAVMWWMVGGQALFQLEIFQHTNPPQRSLPDDWCPSDHGWVRCGIAVTDFDRCIEVFLQQRIPLLAPVEVANGLRRVAVRDPYVGTVIEVLESAPGSAAGPHVRYVAASVSDLNSARYFYADVLGLPIHPLELLHAQKAEALWGLSGARRDGFLVKAGEVWLEILQYAEPSGRPRRVDYRASDQGLLNVAFGSSDSADVTEAMRRVQDAGYAFEEIVHVGEVTAGYLMAAEREIELVSVPPGTEASLGFVRAVPFFGLFQS